jgi:hypothetical protein
LNSYYRITAFNLKKLKNNKSDHDKKLKEYNEKNKSKVSVFNLEEEENEE